MSANQEKFTACHLVAKANARYSSYRQAFSNALTNFDPSESQEIKNMRLGIFPRGVSVTERVKQWHSKK